MFTDKIITRFLSGKINRMCSGPGKFGIEWTENRSAYFHSRALLGGKANRGALCRGRPAPHTVHVNWWEREMIASQKVY